VGAHGTQVQRGEGKDVDPLRRNNVNVSGRGTPMIFAHGYGCDQSMWRYITPHFCDDHQIVLFDHVGMGRSDLTAYDPVKYDGLQAYAQDLLEICAALDLRDVVFVGHSVGGMIGVLAAIEEPWRFAKLVLIGPSPRYVDEGDYVGGFSREALQGLLDALEADYQGTSAAQLAPIIMGNPDRPELTRELAASFCRTNAEVAKRFARVTFFSDNRADLPKVKTQSLIVQCAYDAIAPLQVGQYVHEHIPNSKLVMMRATGHCPNLSAPDETIAAIKSFL
jgi:sigma-B regulation protein RsbQ